MSEIADQILESVERASESWLNNWVAVMVALCATMMGLCNVKDGNVVQAMEEAQAHAVAQWSFYQSKSTKQHIAENTAELIRIQMDTAPQLSAAVRQKLAGRALRVETILNTLSATKPILVSILS